MPKYTIQSPSGKTYTIEGPEGATANQLGQFILSQSQEERVAVTRSQMAEEYSPTKGMGTLERTAAGVGKGLTDFARGAGQLVGLVNRDDVAQSRAIDAPLMDTTAGKVGNFAGKAVPLAAASLLAPGAGTVAGASAMGAGAGLLEPSTSTGETIQNVALGGVTGAAGQFGGNKLADWLAKRAAGKTAQFATQQAANAQKLGAAKAANAQGYVIPPSDIQPQGPIIEALGGLSGKIKTAQTASAKNQVVTDALARKAVGLSPDEALTRDVLKGIRDQAGQAYDAFKTVGTVQADAAYNAALDGVEQTLKGATKSFPGLKSDEVGNLVKTMRQPQFDASDAIDATKVLRGLSEDAYGAGNKTLAKAYRKVSDALEDALDRHLQATAPDAVQQFRDARKLIAKTYTVEKALNSETGQVSAQVLAAQLKRGKPLSDELLTIAKVGDAFKPAMQALKETPKDLSPLDFGAAGLGLVGSGGNPLAALGLVARPTTRAALLSPMAQRNALRDLSGPSNLMSRVTNNELARLLYGTAPVSAVNVGQQ